MQIGKVSLCNGTNDSCFDVDVSKGVRGEGGALYNVGSCGLVRHGLLVVRALHERNPNGPDE